MLAACEMSGRVAHAFARRGWEAVSCDLLPSEQEDMVYKDWSVTPFDGDIIDGKLAGSVRHHQGDVLGLFEWGHRVNARRLREREHALSSVRDQFPLWDLVIAFPPCTHLTLGGARYWKEKDAYRGGDGRMQEGAAFFRAMTRAPAPHVAVENPNGVLSQGRHPDDSSRPHPDFYRVPDQVVQPWMFGDALIKKTCLWLKDLPKLEATHWIGDYPDLERVATGGGSHRVDRRVKGRANNTHEDGEGRDRRGIVRSRTPLGFAQAMAGQWGAHVEMKAAA